MKILGNLTFILNNKSCNKQCPFCIAKGSNKIYNKINIYGETGDFKYYNKDLIISNNCLMNYQEEVMY